jgi:hypothetical protein
MQTIGKDAAPSIIAAQQIKSDLAAMHGLSARNLLGDPGASNLYETRRQATNEALLDAAMNITYGEAEKQPIRKLLNGLGSYEQAVAQARVLHARGDQGFLARDREANRIMHETLLVAADDLDRANFEQLTHGYGEQRRIARWGVVRMLASAMLLLAALLGVQVFLFRRMHRVLNSGLVFATGLVVFGLGLTVVAVNKQSALLKRAKEDAFDSIHALMQARAVAEDARSDMLRGLLDRERSREYGQAYETNSARLAKLPGGQTSADILAAVQRRDMPTGFEGHLASELRNITFVGEEAAARAALESYLRLVDLDRSIQKLAEEGKQADALPRGLGTGANDAGGAFAQFEEALGKTLKINRDEFDRSVDQGFAALSGYDLGYPAAGIGVALLALLGLRPRLKEYNFS